MVPLPARFSFARVIARRAHTEREPRTFDCRKRFSRRDAEEETTMDRMASVDPS